MRIVGGEWKGLGLAGLGKGDPGAQLRPTSDRTRESLFNILAHGDFPEIEGARVLDLFAGTGALGLEALSRGAAEAVFVENGRVALGLLGQNIARTRSEGTMRVLRRDATRLGLAEGPPFDLAFLDPPYGKGLGTKALCGLRQGGWIAAGGLAILEEGEAIEPPPGFVLAERRSYGAAHLHFLFATEEAPA